MIWFIAGLCFGHWKRFLYVFLGRVLLWALVAATRPAARPGLGSEDDLECAIPAILQDPVFPNEVLVGVVGAQRTVVTAHDVVWW